MQKFLISAAVAVSALAVATPAAAQWMPQPLGYGSSYGYMGQAQALQAQIGQLRMQIGQLGRSNMLSYREFRRLDREAGMLDQRVRAAAYMGMNPRESYDIQRRIARLQQRIQYAMYSGNRSYGNRGYGYGGYGYGGYGSGGYGSAGYGYGNNGGAYGAYSGLGGSYGRSSHYGRKPSYNGHTVQAVPSRTSTGNVSYGGRETYRAPAMRSGRDRGYSSRGWDARNRPSFNGGRDSSRGARGTGKRG